MNILIQQEYPRFGLVSKGTKKVTDVNYISINKWTYISCQLMIGESLFCMLMVSLIATMKNRVFWNCKQRSSLYNGRSWDCWLFSRWYWWSRHLYNRRFKRSQIKEISSSPYNTVTRLQPINYYWADINLQPLLKYQLLQLLRILHQSQNNTGAYSFMTKKSPGFSSIFVFMGIFFCILFLRAV